MIVDKYKDAEHMAADARGRRDPFAKRIDYAERLFKIKQLEHKRWMRLQDGPFDEPMRDVEEMDDQISKLLEDE